MKPAVKITICLVVAAALIGALCLLLLPAASWQLPRIMHLGSDFDDKDYHIGASDVTERVDEVEIDWSAGSIRVTTHDGDGIRITESGYETERQQLRWRVVNGKLIIREHAPGLSWSLPHKALELSLPASGCNELSIDAASAEITLDRALTLRKLEADTASGSLSADELTADEVSFDSASGDCTLRGCDVGKFDMDTASGKAVLSGRFGTLELDSASGDLELTAQTVPGSIETDTVSGKISLALPEDAQFQAELDSVSGDLNVEDFSGSYRGDVFTAGSGGGRYRFESVSGDVDIFFAR